MIFIELYPHFIEIIRPGDVQNKSAGPNCRAYVSMKVVNMVIFGTESHCARFSSTGIRFLDYDLEYYFHRVAQRISSRADSTTIYYLFHPPLAGGGGAYNAPLSELFRYLKSEGRYQCETYVPYSASIWHSLTKFKRNLSRYFFEKMAF